MEVSENLLSKPVQAFYHKDYTSIVVLRADNTREFVPIRTPLKNNCASITIQEITITNGEVHHEYGVYPHDTGDSILKNGTTVYVVTDPCFGSARGEPCHCKLTPTEEFGMSTNLDNGESCEYARVKITRLPVEFL